MQDMIASGFTTSAISRNLAKEEESSVILKTSVPPRPSVEVPMNEISRRESFLETSEPINPVEPKTSTLLGFVAADDVDGNKHMVPTIPAAVRTSRRCDNNPEKVVSGGPTRNCVWKEKEQLRQDRNSANVAKYFEIIRQYQIQSCLEIMKKVLGIWIMVRR